jgi:hypothetical protein
MLVGAARGAAHVLFRTYEPPAARASPPAGVKLVTVEVHVAQQMVFGIRDVASCLDAGQGKVNTFGRVVGTWRLIVSHCRPASCCRDGGVPPGSRFGRACSQAV